MPLEESFSTEPAPAAPEAAPAAVEAPELAPEAPQLPEAATEPAEVPATPEPVVVEPAPVVEPASVPVAEVPAFNEADFFKQALGDDAPATAAELKAQYDALKAKQITPEVEAQLAILRDPAKMQEFASIVGKDYDKAPAREVMLERFAQQHPGMPTELLEDEFSAHFETKYPLMAQKLAEPDSVANNDPALIREIQKAEYYSQADRAALKETQKEDAQKFIAVTAAPQAPLLTPAQQADANALPAWLDEAIRDGATLPVDLGEGVKVNLPIEKAADFKAAFNDTYKLLDAFVLGKDGLLNRPNQALVTAFMQNPQAFVKNIAQQALAAQPKPAPAIPLADLASSSAARPVKPVAPPAPAGTTYNEGTPHQNFNY